METLRQKISELFNISKPIKEDPKKSNPKPCPEPEPVPEPEPQASKEEERTMEPITSGDLPTPELKMKRFSSESDRGDFSYQLEFVDFVDRNAPKGLSKKLVDLFPYLEVSFISWPAYWFYRGYNWQHRRNTERIGVYIQRTYQQAKLMQLAILATGLLAVTMARSPIQIQKMEYKQPDESP